MNIEKGRIQWIDASKGILIILVVMYHYIQSFCPDLTVFTKIVSAFFMQAFFALSGFLINTNLPFGKFVKRKAKSLLIPYCVFCLLLLIYKFMTAVFNNDVTSLLEQLKETLIPTIFIYRNSFFNVLWFFPCLFCSVIIVRIILQKAENKIFGLFITATMAVLMYLLANKTSITLPLCLDTAGVAAFWIYVGYCIKDVNVKTKRNKLSLICVSAIIFLIFSILLVTLYPKTNYYDSFRNIRYTNVIFTLLLSISATVLVICAGKKLQKTSVLISVGQKTDIIYGLHFLFLGVTHSIFKYVYDSESILYQIFQVLIFVILVLIISFIIYSIKIRLLNKFKKT